MSSTTRRFASVAAAIVAMVILQPAAVRVAALATLEVVASSCVCVAEAGSGGASRQQ